MTTLTYILIVFAHVGPLGESNSNALTSIGGFADMQACQDAGNQTRRMAQGTVKNINFVCAPTQKARIP